MGGIGSGNWYRWDNRPKTSSMLALDLRQIKKRGCLRNGGGYRWRWSINGEQIGCIDFRVTSTSLQLDYRYQGEPMKYAVPFDYTRMNFGGERRWFLCPASGCGKRVSVLYGGRVFACRDCYRLVYPCQSENRGSRALMKADKIRDKLGWEPGVANGWGPKPKGMHWAKFERLAMRHETYVRRCDEFMDSTLRRSAF